jgi:hypothetical protein
MSFTVTLTVGAALLAMWVDARFPVLRPKSVAGGLAHAAAGVLAVIGAAGFMALIYGIPQTVWLGVLLSVFLPALVYSLLTGLWMLRSLADMTFAR